MHHPLTLSRIYRRVTCARLRVASPDQSAAGLLMLLLHPVTSPALGRELVLCDLHAQAELTGNGRYREGCGVNQRRTNVMPYGAS